MPIIDGPLVITTSHTHEVRRYKRIEWNPQDDMTTLELAKLMPLLMSMAKDPMAHWEDYIPPEARRHFKIFD